MWVWVFGKWQGQVVEGVSQKLQGGSGSGKEVRVDP